MAKKTIQFPAKLTPTKEEGGRYFFTDVEEDFPFPDLIGVQTESYKWFLEHGIGE